MAGREDLEVAILVECEAGLGEDRSLQPQSAAILDTVMIKSPTASAATALLTSKMRIVETKLRTKY